MRLLYCFVNVEKLASTSSSCSTGRMKASFARGGCIEKLEIILVVLPSKCQFWPAVYTRIVVKCRDEAAIAGSSERNKFSKSLKVTSNLEQETP